ncbi:MAG: ORF6N domain-containing protein [Desulfomonile tiedjei]|nr:ORF6N domain-containing protein [Desulfomonile tiedjei]
MAEELPSSQLIENRIFNLRGHRVMLDSHLAELYGVTTGNLNKAVARNAQRFPDDFMFQLTKEERTDLKFQNGISSTGHGGRRYLPRAFTQEGIAMLSGVLRSPRAIQVNIAIMRAFVRLREIMHLNRELASKLSELERKLGKHDEEIQIIFKVIKQLMAPPPEKPKRRIGFKP